MATPANSDALNALFDKIYRDAMTDGIGLFKVSLFDELMKAERLPRETVFRIKLRPFPGYSHAHSRKIRREARERDGITVRLTSAWTMSDLQITNGHHD